MSSAAFLVIKEISAPVSHRVSVSMPLKRVTHVAKRRLCRGSQLAGVQPLVQCTPRVSVFPPTMDGARLWMLASIFLLKKFRDLQIIYILPVLDILFTINEISNFIVYFISKRKY